jgi:hypothetical protein
MEFIFHCKKIETLFNLFEDESIAVSYTDLQVVTARSYTKQRIVSRRACGLKIQ